LEIVKKKELGERGEKGRELETECERSSLEEGGGLCSCSRLQMGTRDSRTLCSSPQNNQTQAPKVNS
jgi:hypothetical protein